MQLILLKIDDRFDSGMLQAKSKIINKYVINM